MKTKKGIVLGKNRIRKRVISIFMTIAMLICIVPNVRLGECSEVQASTIYNGNSAAIYGLTYTDNSGGSSTASYNKSYTYYSGNDCANFVSQSLVAGGLQTDGTWYTYSRAWNRADYLLEWFKAKPEFSNLIVRNPSPWDVKRGDPLFYVWGTEVGGKTPNDIDHAGICTGTDANGNPLVSAHTSNRKNYSAWRMGAGAVYVVKLHELIPNQSSVVNLGDSFCAYIVNSSFGKNLTADADRNVTMRSETGASNQIWHFYRQGDGSYEIVNCSLKLALDVYAAGQANGTNVQVHDRNNSSAQRWFISGEQGNYNIKSGCGPAVLDVTDNSPADGTNIQMWECNGLGAQKFQIVKLNAPGASTLKVIPGTSTTPTSFAWTKPNNALWYDLYIYKDTLYTGQDYTVWGSKNLSCSKTLPTGNYIAYIESCNNTDLRTTGNKVSFTVETESTLAKCDLTDMNKIHGGFKLYWNTVSGATKYEIYRRKLTDSAYTKIATVSGGNINTYDDRTCVTGTAYSYKVKAANNSGAGEYGKGYYSLYLDYTNLWSADISTDSIELSWDNVKGADGYYVYQQNADNTYTKIKDIESGMANGCTISGLKQNTTYNYIVRAYGRYTYNSKTTIYTGYRSNTLSVTTKAYNGLVQENGAYYYYRNGVKQTGYTGLMKHTDNTWCYVITGKWQLNYTGIVRNTNGKYYYVYKGRRNYSSKLVKYTDGSWLYVKNGEWQPDYTGIVRNTNGKYYYVYKGRRNYSSKLVKYTDGSWLYVKNGEWQPNYTGIVRNTNGKYYYVYKGRRNYSSKLVKYTDGSWLYVKNGEWQPNYTGIVKQPSGKKYYVVKGKKEYKTGYVTVGGRRYRVVKGEVR